VNITINVWVSQKARNVLTSSVTVSFSWTLLHSVSHQLVPKEDNETHNYFTNMEEVEVYNRHNSDSKQNIRSNRGREEYEEQDKTRK
jgi:hypothetical protein